MQKAQPLNSSGLAGFFRRLGTKIEVEEGLKNFSRKGGLAFPNRKKSVRFPLWLQTLLGRNLRDNGAVDVTEDALGLGIRGKGFGAVPPFAGLW